MNGANLHDESRNFDLDRHPHKMEWLSAAISFFSTFDSDFKWKIQRNSHEKLPIWTRIFLIYLLFITYS